VQDSLSPSRHAEQPLHIGKPVASLGQTNPNPLYRSADGPEGPPAVPIWHHPPATKTHRSAHAWTSASLFVSTPFTERRLLSPDEAANDSERLNAVLDRLRSRQQPLFGKYIVQSALDRRAGGQGCIQFVRDANTFVEYAVKFFYDRAAFEHERALYAEAALRPMMAATREVGDPAAANGNAAGVATPPPLPPYIVLE
jgi:hypothetical protein